MKRTFWLILIVLTSSWLIAEPALLNTSGFFPWRNLMVQLTGVLAMGCMSIAMVLALRPRWLEDQLNGLDKMYRLHKWLGIGGLVLAITHWLTSKAPKWSVGWGWLDAPKKTPPVFASAVEELLFSYRGTAELIGEWAFYAVVILIVLALIHRFPYHLFYKTHRLLAIAYLVLVAHSVLLIKFNYWSLPVGWLTALLMVAGTWAAVVVLLRRVGTRRQVPGQIAGIRYFPGVKTLEVKACVTEWPGHEPGQFAFVTTDSREGFHPYTIASDWRVADPCITFAVKELGDHTSTLRERLKVGQPVSVEGPYGRFTFDDTRPRQIWIGGGIGVTPFIARSKYLATHANTGKQVDFFHSTGEVDEQALALIAENASHTDIRLHVLIDARDGYLTGERIRATVPDWRDASIWFCGPSSFGEALRRDFAAQGFPVERHFHQELFNMR
ncbi:MAG: ferric reductase [Alcaligenaceae bacterium]|nr:ferric reductase [Alcaligenaceae bacterium]